jgi:plasmid stabilization system protein ParE
VTSYRITVTARAQIAALYAWSIERWGAAHARRYLEDLDAGVRDLIETPALASPRPDLDRSCSYAVFAPTIIYTLRFSQKDSSSSPCCTTEWMRCAIWGRR